MDAAQLFLFVPIPAKAKKLGLLSIYKFSLAVRYDRRLRKGSQSLHGRDCLGGGGGGDS